MHSYILLLTHSINLWLFWEMWGGFYLNKCHDDFQFAAIMQIVMIVSSMFFFAIRNTPLAKKIFNFSEISPDINQDKAAIVASLSGAYVLSLLNIILIALLWLYAGSIDIWALSQAT